jgi:hypothetical protein
MYLSVLSTRGGWDDWPGRAPQRVAAVAQASTALRDAVEGWLRDRRGDQRFARFSGHFDVLGPVLDRMLDRIDDAIRACLPSGDEAPKLSAADTYRDCRAIEEAIAQVRRLFDWYATKYDQRLAQPAHGVLAAADELVRSCWSQMYAGLPGSAPGGPLPYLDANFDALATPRKSVPTDLRAPADARVAESVNELPIATIALPANAAVRGWWLVLAAHETGHHIYDEFELETSVRAAVRSAAEADPHGTAEAGKQWNRWHAETFADVYSALMVGGAAAWALAELQYAAPADLVRPPSETSRYPAPLVRLAVIGESAACAGLAGPLAVTAADARAWLDDQPEESIPQAARTAAQLHLAITPAIAAALLDLRIDRSRRDVAQIDDGKASDELPTLAELCGAQPAWFAPGGKVTDWAVELCRTEPTTLDTARRAAARQAIAAGVGAYDALARSDAAVPADADVQLLHKNLITLLSRCGGPGVLAETPPTRADLTALADRLADRLLAAPPPEVAL